MRCPARQGRLSRTIAAGRSRAAIAAVLALFALTVNACGLIGYGERPASGYVYGSGAPLRVAVIDATGGDDWSPAVDAAIERYAAAVPQLAFQRAPGGANIVITVHRYDDAHPPPLPGYIFPLGAGGFASVYDADGTACNFPPSTLPLHCSGEIGSAEVYLNDIIPPGADIEARRERLVLHEMGHALGLTRHTPDTDAATLAARYGW